MIEPMAKKTRSKAGTRDLTAAVAKVHTPVKPRVKKEEMTSVSYAKGRLAKTPEALLLAAGDDPGREHFFDLDDSGKPRRRSFGKPVHLVLERGAALPDYRTRDGKRNHRTLITIPPKMRQVIQEAFGASDGEDFPFTTALIALADYGAMVLKREKRMLVVSPAEDAQAEERKEIRKLVRIVGLKK